jgi:hypothetical protein
MFYRGEVKSAATLHWQVVAAVGGKILATTPAMSAAAGWTNLKVEFTVPENNEAVVVRFVRDACRNVVCPASGKFWFDDFSLTQ